MKKKIGILAPQYRDESIAREYLERLLWPDGPVCPHCGLMELDERKHYRLTAKPESEKPVRKGVYKCFGCRKQFTVTVNTIFSDSKIPLHKWLLAIHLMCTSKKGVSAHQLYRNLDLGSYRTAWFMAHRIRWALGQEPIASKLTGTFEIDELWIGGKDRPRSKKEAEERRLHPIDPNRKKTPVVAVLHREGDVRSFSGKVTGQNRNATQHAGLGEIGIYNIHAKMLNTRSIQS